MIDSPGGQPGRRRERPNGRRQRPPCRMEHCSTHASTHLAGSQSQQLLEPAAAQPSTPRSDRHPSQKTFAPARWSGDIKSPSRPTRKS